MSPPVIGQVTMLEWTPEQRALLAETLRDIANVAAGAMVFGQFLSDRGFAPWLAVLGVAVWIILVIWALRLAGGRES
ncbi:MAG: hypothetical protein HY657_11130 [Acidobacteria bacterium]|nr:hypothetical protein [Acidobacteriota bacterium]